MSVAFEAPTRLSRAVVDSWSEFRSVLTPGRGLIARLGDAIVGYIEYETSGRDVKVYLLETHPDYRRCGIGRQMVERVVSDTHPRSVTAVCVTGNEAAGFWRALGFEYVSGSDEADMRREWG